VSVDAFQSNHEGAIVDAINDAIGRYDGLIINAGALTHYSYSIRDAVAASGIAAVEVHISNIYEREEWRHFSVLTDVCELTIVGRGTDGYRYAIDHLVAADAVQPVNAAYSDRPEAVLDLRTPTGDGPHPVALLIHGGFWREVWKRDLMDSMAIALTEHGWATANVEYTRGQGSYASAPHDVTEAVEWIRDNAVDHELDAERIIAIGHSAGGFLALQLAHHESPVAAVVSLAGVTDLEATSRLRPDDDPVTLFLGRTHEDAPRLWEQAELEGSAHVPVHLIHGADDDSVPASQSKTYAEKHDRTGSLTIISDCTHMDLIDPRADSWQSVVAALEQFRT
jgi:3-dehydroquinate dehydratase/pimeloyl-ACP methyl ester carboxylesterase